MIEVNHLIKWYGRTLAVNNVSFQIPRGQVVGLLGPNGAGKSTILRMLTAFLPPSSGSVVVDGLDAVTQSLGVRQKIGYLPENTPLYPEMRVEEFLQYRGRLYRMDRATRKERIDRVCDQCGLGGVRRRLIGQLSKGNKQRVGLAQALLHDPPVIILDEPTAGLDPNQITQFRELIRQLSGRYTIVLSTHILPEIEKTADRVIVIAAGNIVAEGSPDDLRRSVAAHSDIRLEVKADSDAVANTLRQIKGVDRVQTVVHDSWCRAVITPQSGCDPREALGQSILSQGWPIREMCYESSSLEAFFVQITAQQDQSSSESIA